MEIETKSARLDTLAVTIQALHVNGKQMTLSVFRQLPIVSAYNQDYTIADIRFWGIVRYAIKDEGSLWAVADNNGILYRCEIEDFIFRFEKDYMRDLDRCKYEINTKIQRIEKNNKIDHENYQSLAGFYDSENEKLTKEINALKECVLVLRDRILLVETAKKTKDYLLSLPQLFIAV